MTVQSFAETEQAERDRDVKASAIAWWCWDHGVEPAELAGLEVKLRGRVARSAGVNPPRGWATWAVVVGKLEQVGVWAEANPGHAKAARRGALGRPEWLSTTEIDPAQKNSSASPKEETVCGAADAAAGGSPEPGGHMLPVLKVIPGGAGETELEAAIARHPASGTKTDGELTLSTFHRQVQLPKGWESLVASGRVLGHGRTCGISRCSGPAVAAAGATLRCADHPPMHGEWGYGLDWTPVDRPCAPNRCYRGCCASWRPPMIPQAPAAAERKDRQRAGGRR